MNSAGAAPWWREAVIYQAYPRSFADSNADGVGDLAGVRGRLDYLAWLGAGALWLNPIMPSPNADWGYDVADYCDVHPELGTLEDLAELVAAARERGIRLILDLVPNHTSEQHEWFLDARGGRQARHRDWYVWADPKPDGSPPNNWVSYFKGPAWSLDEGSGQYYLHHFLPEQPDLDWWNEDVRAAFDRILRFWFERGVAGFRIDVAHVIVKDKALRDNPPAGPGARFWERSLGQRTIYNFIRPEVHDVFRRWRALADAEDPPRVLIGEGVTEPDEIAAFYGTGEDELHLTFNLGLNTSQFDAAALRRIVEESEKLLPTGGWPLWTLGNHDSERFATRWAGGDERKSRTALLLLLTLRGTPTLYYGDELALPATPVDESRRRDPVGRDPARTPMPWNAEPGAGFTAAGVEPWLPLGDHEARNVVDQRENPASTLRLTRDLIALRQDSKDLRSGGYESLPAPDGVWAWRRGEETTVAVNLSDEERDVEQVHGTLVLSTDRERAGEEVRGRLTLAPWQGAVLSATHCSEPLSRQGTLGGARRPPRGPSR